MSIKYEILSYFFSILINLLFLFVFFSTLHFVKPTENKIKVKVISGVEVAPQSLEEKMPLKENKKEINQIFPINQRKIIEEKHEEIVLTKKLAQIKERISSDLPKEENLLSEEELKTIKEKMAVLQKGKYQKISQEGSFFGDTKEKIEIEYLLLIKRQLENNFEVPIYLRSKKDLYALVEMEISSEGKILTYQFLKEASDFEFNKAIQRCLKASSPLPINKKIKVIVEFKAEGIGKIK